MLTAAVSAIGLMLALTTIPVSILQTMSPVAADNPVRGADATVSWIVASGRDRSPTFEELVGRLSEVKGSVIVCWSARQVRGVRAVLVEQVKTLPDGTRSLYVVLHDAGDTDMTIALLGQELQRAIDALEGRPADAEAAARVGKAIRQELKRGQTPG